MIHILVINSLNDPVPGWGDNLIGMIGILVGGGKGVLRVSKANKHIYIDVMPVDIFVKCLIVIVWKMGLTKYDYYQCKYLYNKNTYKVYLTALSYKYEKKVSFFILNQHFSEIIRTQKPSLKNLKLRV